MFQFHLHGNLEKWSLHQFWGIYFSKYTSFQPFWVSSQEYHEPFRTLLGICGSQFLFTSLTPTNISKPGCFTPRSSNMFLQEIIRSTMCFIQEWWLSWRSSMMTRTTNVFPSGMMTPRSSKRTRLTLLKVYGSLKLH